MKRSNTPPHLPTPPSDRGAHEHLYRFCYGGDVFGTPEDWQERRIPVGLSATEVYHRLPSAPDFEYGGYLTKTRIRFVLGYATGVYTDKDKPCIFHSHPASYRYADVPSPSDIYSFLKWRNLRAITVGAKWIWVWNKNKHVLVTVERLLEWEARYMLDEMRRLLKRRTQRIFDTYFLLALDAIGVDCSARLETDPKTWRLALSRSAGIETALIPRESAVVG